ncbi:hypothetical protein ILUMI_16089, partial [Ignelater luminosus]
MTYRKYFLHDFQELNDCATLRGNSVLKVTEKGRAKVRNLIKDQWTNAVINKVFYIPEPKPNLLSEGVLTGKSIKTVKSQERASIFYNDELVGVALKGENKIYHLQMEALVNQVNKTANISIWHKRLGHINDEFLKRVPDVVNDIKMSHVDKKYFCTGCVVGKLHKSCFKSCEKRKTKAGGLTHCDVGGLLPQPSVSEFNYFLLMKDDYAHFRFVTFLRHKSNVIDELKSFIQF